MKRLLFLFVLATITGCTSFESNPYQGQTHSLVLKVVYPGDYADEVHAGLVVTLENTATKNSYSATTDAQGVVRFTLTNGLYRVMTNDRIGTALFNATIDQVKVADADAEATLSMIYSKAGSIIVKEIYCGGCSKAPEQGTFSMDKYIILHNNSETIAYLDELCFGTIDPTVSTATNPWITTTESGEVIYPDFVPIADVVWQFGGSGTDFPLEPGEDVVVAVNGAVDHTAVYPLSVNLNNEKYFVCYNSTYFPHQSYHPTPGDKIRQDHILKVAIYTGRSSAFTFALGSPTAVLFRAPDGESMADYLADVANSVVSKPGSSETRCAKIPLDWITDAVEVFNGGSSNNKKRLAPMLDAGFALLSATGQGRTLHRVVDEQATAEAGITIYKDTNNSTVDFFERPTQSLHE